jgi:hypothetical protein
LEDHAQNHRKNKIFQQMNKPERTSVNIRLKNIKSQRDEQTEDNLNAAMKSLDFSNLHETKAKSAMETNDRDILLMRKFKRHVPILNKSLDSEGFFLGKVTHIGATADFPYVYSIVPFDYNESLKSYLKELQSTYENANFSLPKLQDIISNQKSLLFMVKINQKWIRCIVNDFDNQLNDITVEDIDSGEQFTSNFNNLAIKIANEREMAQTAYCLKVHFVNPYNRESINVGHVIKIKVVKPSMYFSVISPAEVLMDVTDDDDDDDYDDNDDTIKELEQIKDADDRFFLDMILVREFQIGRKLKVTYLDGQCLDVGRLHVCESTPENYEYYCKLSEEIKEYIHANPNANNYKPM